MNLPNPLLPLPDEPSNQQNLAGTEALENAAVVSAIDYVNLHAMAWPARDSMGNLVPPPAEHVFHDLAHVYDLVDEESLLTHPKLGVVYVDSELPSCDLCDKDARYDAIIEMHGSKGGAFLCGDHYSQHGSGTLGASGDTYLMLMAEVPDGVQKGCNELLAAQGRAPLF